MAQNTGSPVPMLASREPPLGFRGSLAVVYNPRSCDAAEDYPSMELNVQQWPLLFNCLAMIVAAVIDGWKRKVPNWLTFPLILSGWTLGLLHNLQVPTGDNGQGGIGTSLICTLLGFALMFPIYAIGGMGAGDGKMVMGFGAWIGAYFSPAGRATQIMLIAFAIGVLIGGVIGLAMMLVRGRYRENVTNARVILLSFVTSGGLTQIADKGNQIRAKEPKLPYGIPLCIGFVGYLYYLAANGQLQPTL